MMKFSLMKKTWYRNLIFATMLFLAFAGPLYAGQSTNMINNPTFAHGSDGWFVYGATLDKNVSFDSHSASLYLEQKDPNYKGQLICQQDIELNQTDAAPFSFGCSSKSLGISTSNPPSHTFYGVELCIMFQDGSNEWLSPKKCFSTGTHDWETIEEFYTPPRPVKTVRFHFRLNQTTGKAWFDNFFLYVSPNAQNKLSDCNLWEHDGLYTLENSFLKIEINPVRGGTCDDFLVKKDNAQYAGYKPPEVMFTDRLRVGGNCAERIYRPEILTNTAEEIALKLSVTAPEGYPFLILSKTFRLTKHSSALEVEYEYFNQPDSMAELILEPYFRSAWNLQKSPLQSYLIPTAAGIERHDNQGGDLFVNPIAGWIASLDGQGRSMVFEYDYARLSSLYFWLGGEDFTTVEPCFNPVNIPMGESFKTTLYYYPTCGLKNVFHAENGIAAGLHEHNDGALEIAIAGSSSCAIKARSVLHLLDGKTQTVDFIQQEFSPDTLLTYDLPVNKSKLAGVVLSLFSENNLVFEGEKWFLPGHEYIPKVPKAKPAEIKPFSLELSDDLQTPHTKWAKPYSQGKTKVLFLVDLSLQREIVELGQRFDLDYSTIRIARSANFNAWGMCDRFAVFSFADSNDSLAEKLEKDYDCIVASGMLWRHLSAENIAKIKTQMDNGTGLLLIDPSELPQSLNLSEALQSQSAKAIEPSPALRELIPMTLTDGASKLGLNKLSDFVYAAENASTRCVALGYFAFEGLTPVISYDSPEPKWRYQDYSLGFIGRALLWCAHKEPTLTIDEMAFTNNQLNIKLSSLDTKDLTCEIILSHPEIGCRQSAAVPFEPELDLPAAPLPGRNICDVILKQDGKVLNWNTIIIDIPKAQSIKSFEFSDKTASCDRPLSGDIIIAGNGNMTLVTSLWDGYERLLAQKENIGISAGKHSFEMPVPEIRTGLLFVKAHLFANGKIVDCVTKEILAPHRPELSSFLPFAVGDQGYNQHFPRYLNKYRYDAFRKGGANELRHWEPYSTKAFTELSKYGFPVDFPLVDLHVWGFNKDFSEPYSKTGDKKYLCRKPCLNDPDYLANTRSGITASLERLEVFSPSSYDVGDENSLTQWGTAFDFCFSAHTLNAFREWLKTQYATLDELNQEWKRNFRSWNDVTPALTNEIRQEGNRAYAAWADHRRFMELTFCKTIAMVKDVMKAKGVDAPLDMSGTQPPNGFTGMDFWLLSNVIDIPAAYDRENNTEIIRSFGRPMLRPWYGYGTEGPGVGWRMWNDALRFKNYGISYYEGLNMVQPDLTLPRQVRELNDYTKPLRDGAGLLLRNLYEQPEVLIHYSHHSIHAAYIENRYGDLLASRAFWCKLLDDLNISYRFVSYQEIEDGELEVNSAKILVLPCSIALSSLEVKQIEKFVSKGGLLLADRFAGLMNEHCTLQPKGMLNNLFGLQVGDDCTSSKVQVALAGENIMLDVSPAIAPAPCLGPNAGFLNHYGNGAAFYLNAIWPQYNQVRSTSEHVDSAWAFRNLIMAQIKDFRSEKAVHFVANQMTNVKTFLYHEVEPKSDARFFALQREADVLDATAEINVEMNRPYFLYELLNKKCFGLVQQHAVMLRAGETLFFAALPYQVSNVKLSLNSEKQPLGNLHTLKIAVQAENNDIVCAGHTIKVCVYPPNTNVPHELYSKIVYAPNGQAEFTFRSALNDVPGVWRIVAKDFISDKSAVVMLNLE